MRSKHDPKAIRMAQEYQSMDPDQKRSFDWLNLNPEELPQPQERSEEVTVDYPELPEKANTSADPAECEWLDLCMNYIRTWATRGYEHFYELAAMFILSTVAARRIYTPFGRKRYPSLYMAMVARSSLFTKTSVAEVAVDLLRRAGFAYLLAPDNATPQSFLASLTRQVPEGYDHLIGEEQILALKRLAFAGQRGWYFGEFGQQMRAMMRESGYMADFRGLLRIFDDGNETYINSTIGRGKETVFLPYLSLLAGMTPDDLRPYARRGAGLWGDGYLARFALVTPPDSQRSYGRFPKGERIPPAFLLSHLQEWDRRLGTPQVEVLSLPGNEGRPSGKTLRVGPYPQTCLPIADSVGEALYAYHDALLDLTQKFQNSDLDGNYARFSEKALRIAMLLASVNNDGAVALPHWVRAQQITEHWRAGLHELYRQLNAPAQTDEQEKEDRILNVIERKGPATIREIKQTVRLSYSEIEQIVFRLMKSEIIEALQEGKTTRYRMTFL